MRWLSFSSAARRMGSTDARCSPAGPCFLPLSSLCSPLRFLGGTDGPGPRGSPAILVSNQADYRMKSSSISTSKHLMNFVLAAAPAAPKSIADRLLTK